MNWLRSTEKVKEHQTPKGFELMLQAYLKQVDAKEKKLGKRWMAHQEVLSDFTRLLHETDITAELRTRLASKAVNEGGFRSALSQGLAKTTGENFANIIVYALADCLQFQDRILVDKGTPPGLRDCLALKRQFLGTKQKVRDLEIRIEVDACVYDRKNPKNAILINSKTRLKEIFHIGTMWKLFFDMISDPHCLKKWNLEASKEPLDLLYVFATADNIREGGLTCQGADVGRESVRNLIAVDASFFDYVFVSKRGFSHISSTLDMKKGREALFHELGCIWDLVQQKFGLLRG